MRETFKRFECAYKKAHELRAWAAKLREEGVIFPELAAALLAFAIDSYTDILTAHARFISNKICPKLDMYYLGKSVISPIEERFSILLQRQFELNRPNRINYFPIIFTNSTDYYNEFVERMIRDGFSDLTENYSVELFEILTQIREIAKQTAIAVARFARDQHQLSGKLGGVFLLSDLISVSPGRSDPHNGQQSVALFTFIGERFLIYKPKDLWADILLSDVINLIQNGKLEHYPRALKAFSDQEYGWQEFIIETGSISESSAKAFYYRAGTLLAIAHFLSLSDCHNGNFIAAADNPYLVDAEVIGYPQPHSEFLAISAIYGSVRRPRDLLYTNFLPQWAHAMSSSSKAALEQAAFAHPEMIGWLTPAYQWKFPGSDAQSFTASSASPSDSSNLPRSVQGSIFSPGDFVGDIIAGFEGGYSALLSQRDQLLRKIKSIPIWKRARLIFRDTDQYLYAMRESWDARIRKDFSKEDATQNVLRKLFSGPFNKFNGLPQDILDEEIRCSEAFDVPKFEVLIDGANSIMSDDLDIPWILYKSPRESMISQLECCNTSDMVHQSEQIRRAFSAISLAQEKGQPRAIWEGDEKRANIPNERLAVPRQRLNWAEEYHNTEDIYGYVSVKNTDKLRFARADLSIYHGLCGPSLAALDYFVVNRDEKSYKFCIYFVRRCIVALQTLAELSDNDRRSYVTDGTASGISGTAYCGFYVASFLHAMDAANEIAHLLGVVSASFGSGADQSVFDGNSGNLLALVGIPADFRTSQINSSIERVARQLHRSLSDSFLEGAEVGFGHGTSGIGYALLLAGRILNERKYTLTAENLLVGESLILARWSREYGVSQTKFHDRISTHLSLCGGYCGSVLLACELGNGAIEHVQFAVESLSDSIITKNFSLCCGASGQLFTLNTLLRRGYDGGVSRSVDLQNVADACRVLYEMIQSSYVPTQIPGLFSGDSGVDLVVREFSSGCSTIDALRFQPNLFGMRAPSG